MRSHSPSGCTFWGKKPWSRKKKLMWQLGTLVGAPVGIALVAGIAVPAMIIGKTAARIPFVKHNERHLIAQVFRSGWAAKCTHVSARPASTSETAPS